MSPRKRTSSDGLPESVTKDKKSYRWLHPVTRKYHYLGTDREAAIRKARKADAMFRQDIMNGIRITVARVIDEYIAEVIPYKPWDAGTIVNVKSRLGVYSRDLGARLFYKIDRIALAKWLNDNAVSNDTHNKHRERWVDLYRFAISKGYVAVNEADAVLKRSMSKKLAANQRQRQRLDLDGYRVMYEHKTCPDWLRLAMDLSLVTLQARLEVVRMAYDDEKDGELFVIRDKVSAVSEMAFIRITVGPALRKIIDRSRRDNLLSPLIVHAEPKRRHRKYMDAKRHWTAVHEDYLTRHFRKVREATGHWDSLEPGHRPTFHEIRSLGGRLYIQAGYAKAYVQSLMTHTDKKTTEIYLSGGALSASNYRAVRADLDPSALK